MSKPSDDSASRRHVLLLSPEAPYPVHGGGPLRTASLIEYLRPDCSVEVITFQEPGAPDPKPQFPNDVAVKVIRLPRHSKTAYARAVRNLGRAMRRVPPLIDRFSGFDAQIAAALAGRYFDLAIVEHFWCAHYAGVLRRRCERVVLDLHNIESVLLARMADAAEGPSSVLLRRFAKQCAELERQWIPRFDEVLVTSEADRAHLARHATVYPNAIPYVPRPAPATRDGLVFSGNLGYHPNQSAVRWFHSEVWPALSRTHPSLTWRIAGKNHEAVGDLASDRVLLTGPMEDAVQSIASARVAIAPLVSGSGTRIKIIEAWAAGLPVVSTTLGAEGLPYTPGRDLLIADTPDDFARAVTHVLESPESSLRLGENGRRLYEERLTWEAAWCALRNTSIESVKS